MARSRLRVVSLMLLICFVDGVHAGDDSPMKKVAEVKRLELHRLSNEDLLKQSMAIHERATLDYLAQLREVAAGEVMLKSIQSKASTLKGAEEKSDDKKGSGDGKDEGKKPSEEEVARAALERAEARQKAAKRALELAEAEGKWLRRIADCTQRAQSAGTALQDALEDLKEYVLEIELRVKDGTLAEEKVPLPLKNESIEKKKGEVLERLGVLKRKQEEGQKALAEASKGEESRAKAVRTADADLSLAAKAYAREQNRASMEKTHAAKQPEVLLAELDQLRVDGIGLKGTYELAIERFKARAKQAEKLRLELEALKTPEAKIPQLTRAEDLELAAKSIQGLMDYYNARSKKIEELQTALTELVKRGEEFEADAAVSSDHLFKMVVLGGLLQKAAFPEEKLPEEVRPKRLTAAAERQAKSAAEVLSAAEKAKGELPTLQKQLADIKAAGDAATAQLDNLVKSSEATLAMLRWEGQLKDLSGPQVIEAFNKSYTQLLAKLEQLKTLEKTFDKARAEVAEARARLNAVKEPLLRAAAEEGAAEKQKLLAEFSKEAGLERAVKNGPTPLNEITKSPTDKPAADKPTTDKTPEQDKKPQDERTELEKVTDNLAAFQQAMAGKLQAQHERHTRKQALIVVLKELEDGGGKLSKTLGEVRALAQEGNVIALDIKKRVGKGELTADTIPEGVNEALRGERRKQLEATAASVLQTLSQVQQLRENISRPDPAGDTLKTLTQEVIDLVGKRIDLIADLKRLMVEHQRERSSLSPSEQKRLEQVVVERLEDGSSRGDLLLGVVASRQAKTLEELLESYYRELVELEEKEGNLTKQRDKIGQLLDLNQKEETLLVKLQPLLAEHIVNLEALREEEALLARVQLNPKQAQELLKAYQARTGRLLPRPVPLGEKEKAEKVEELAAAVFDRIVHVEAARRWQSVLVARLTPIVGKSSGGVIEAELALVNTLSAANQRRIATLTGTTPAEPGKAIPSPTPVVGGEIASTRADLFEVRLTGIKSLALKIGLVLLAAFLFPWLLLTIIRFVRGGTQADKSDLVYSALRTFLRVGAWIVALVVILSLLGVDVTAILAGLGIGGLAIGLAAQPMIADIIAAIVIFIERRLKIGDVIRIDDWEPARVVSLSWRLTQVRQSDGVILNIPNRKLTKVSFQNLTSQGRTYDSMTVTITTPGDVNPVLKVIRQAAAECKDIAPEANHVLHEFTQTPESKVVRYTLSWYLPDYHLRNHVRDEVFTRISKRLAEEEWKATEINMA